jgi:hypothetical protein
MRVAAAVAACLALGSGAGRTEEFRLRLTGDPLTATPLVEEEVGIVPFGRFLNALPIQKVQYGVQFTAELDDCSSAGCVLLTEDAARVLVARKPIADGIRLDLYDRGWIRSGSVAISETGRLAAPVSGPAGQRELWILRRVRQEWRMDRRLPLDLRVPVGPRWRGDDLFLRHAGETGGVGLSRVDLRTGKRSPADPLEAFWYDCHGEAPGHWAVGPAGEDPETLLGLTAVPLRRPGSSATGWLELTASVRPQGPNGLAGPVRVTVDCTGRPCVVSAVGEDIWCLRFHPDGSLERASRVRGSVTGDFKSVRIDERGRFLYLITEMEEDGRTPRLLKLMRLR